MSRKYSVFLGNVGSCFDRYCPEYAKGFSFEELFERVASIDLLTGVDLVAVPDLLREKAAIKELLQKSNLQCVSIAADTFTEGKWRQGSYSSTDPSIRKEAVAHTCEVMDFAEEMGSNILTLWPGQDGYDYLMQADYIQERSWFIDCLSEICEYKPGMKVALEYKAKEPRTHSYANTVGTTLLMTQATNAGNCGVALDFGHALLGYENPAESVALLKQFGDKLLHVHINDNYRYWDDDMIVGSVRTLEYIEFIFWLRKTGYNGYMTIDQFPYREDGRNAVAESASWLDYLESLVEKADMDEIQKVIEKKDGVASSALLRKILQG